MNQLIHGDCAQVLPLLQADTFDSLVTDPPASISFMGQAWDGDRGGRKFWVSWLSQVMREALRVLKPGAHGLVWAIPRRSHWTAWALEDAGFEIRDVLHHYFLSGFPKSLNVSKAIDEHLGEEREVVGTLETHDIQNSNYIGSNKLTTYEYTAPASDEAKTWDGWGTHLKPAIEHWWLVRKPLSEKTVALNVLKWGTGALDIAASRIPCEDKAQRHKKLSGWKDSGDRPADPHPDSRYPSHFIARDGLLGGHEGFFHPPIYNPKARRCRSEGNDHPTVKPVELMKYFVRLLTRRGGHVLDCFAGSFTTGVAAQELGFAFTGIEMEAEYVQIGVRRLAA